MTGAELEPFRAAGRAWVAVDADDRPVAYLVSVGRRRLRRTSSRSASRPPTRGAASVRRSSTTSRRVAAAEGRSALTLTTFRDVPWNAPYYERLGFTVIAPADQGPELAALVAEEAERIPGDAPRVAMRRAV